MDMQKGDQLQTQTIKADWTNIYNFSAQNTIISQNLTT